MTSKIKFIRGEKKKKKKKQQIYIAIFFENQICSGHQIHGSSTGEKFKNPCVGDEESMDCGMNITNITCLLTNRDVQQCCAAAASISL